MNESAVGDRFVDKFYTAMDSNRATVPSFYTDTSAILWNGNAMMLPQFTEFLTAYPQTAHTVQSYGEEKGNECNSVRGARHHRPRRSTNPGRVDSRYGQRFVRVVILYGNEMNAWFCYRSR